MATPKLTKTNYVGLYYFKEKKRGKVYVGIFEVNKKRYKRVVGYENDEYRTTAKIAFIKKEQLKDEITKGSATKLNHNMTFKVLYDTYINHVKSSASCSLKTIRNKESTFNAHFSKQFGNINIKNISNFEIQSFANKLLKEKKPKTVQNIISDLAAIFQYALKHKLVLENPAKNIDLPKFDNVKDFPLSHEECKKLFNAIINFEEPLYRGIFTFLLEGRRKDEVLTITWDQINLENKTYTIQYEENKPKKNMTYEMTDELYLNLINYQERKGLVFRSIKTGEKIANMRYAWQRILKSANIKHNITLHEIRHLLGYTLKNEANKSDEIIAAVLGQTTTRSTKRYSKVRQHIAAQGVREAFSSLKDN